MSRQKVEFTNPEGHTLVGALHLPEKAEPRAFALFAHCFTCGKDVVAASRIARALADQGIGVLRFDFTGLGGSDGDFAQTSFSTNVDDLVAAADFLKRDYRAPKLLIGHSLGGAAALVAAGRIPSIDAVSTIAAPASPQHVQHLFADQHCNIQRDGQAEVDIGGRPFVIGAQFVEDMERWPADASIARLDKPLLIFHSPVDQVVNIGEAAKLYEAARHPKSFVSLDKADHLLSRSEDADYVALTLSAWASRYLDLKAPKAESQDRPEVPNNTVLVTEKDAHFLRGLYTTDHQMEADEPEAQGGSNRGPTPYDLLLMALGACTSMTLRMYANHKKLLVEDIEVTLSQRRVHAEDCEDCDNKDGSVTLIERKIRYRGELKAAQHERFLQIADRCPVHKTLQGDIKVVPASED